MAVSSALVASQDFCYCRLAYLNSLGVGVLVEVVMW